MGDMTLLKYDITVEDTGETFVCHENEFILNAMLRRGNGPISHGCCGGGCGVCKMRIVSGLVFIEKRMSAEHITREERENGIALLCCVKPRSDIVLTRVTTTHELQRANPLTAINGGALKL